MSRKRKKTVSSRRRSQRRNMGQLVLTGLLPVILAGGIGFWLLSGVYAPDSSQNTEMTDTHATGVFERAAKENSTEETRTTAESENGSEGGRTVATGGNELESNGTMATGGNGSEGNSTALTDRNEAENNGTAEASGNGVESAGTVVNDGNRSEHAEDRQISTNARTPEEPEKTTEELLKEQVESYLADMTTEEKVLQLFMVTPEALTGYASVTAAGDSTKEAILQYPVGGIVYFAGNLKDPDQVHTMLQNTRKYYEEAGYPAPFLGVDEEGGRVARIGGQSAFGVERIPDMRTIGDSKNSAEAERTGHVIGTYLSELGFSLDFAPVADVLTDPDNQVIGRRSFGTDPGLVADLSMDVVNGLESAGVWAVLKHFPGHGATREDSHDGYAYTDKTLEELMEAELVPFRRGIQQGVHFIMAAHISVPSVTGDTTPCTLSPYMITEILREKMGYEGIVVTDAMNMGAIRQQYDSAEASVLALQAGVDLLLMPADFQSACEGVLEAIASGTLTEERIDESVRRILWVKFCPLS